MSPLLIAEITGNIASAFGLLGAAIGVGLIGRKAAEAVGRNPGASGKILVQAIIGMALAEGLGILALFLAQVIKDALPAALRFCGAPPSLSPMLNLLSQPSPTAAPKVGVESLRQTFGTLASNGIMSFGRSSAS
jgi:F-type H+-transporting ATPase subunit c